MRMKTLRPKGNKVNEEQDLNNLAKGQVSVEERFFLHLLAGFISVGDTEQSIELF